MAQQTIDIGSAPNDGTGDPIRDAFDKCNDNFTELYGSLAGLLDFQGATDCSANPNYPAASQGDIYIVSVAGKIGGASGKVVEVGDFYLALADNAGGTEASVGTSWAVLQANITGGIGAGVDVEDEGVSETVGATTLNFVGAGVTAADAGSGVVDITIPGGGGISGIDVEDEGVAEASAATVLNFTGAGVTATDVGGGQVDIAIPGGGGSEWTVVDSENASASGSIDLSVVAADYDEWKLEGFDIVLSGGLELALRVGTGGGPTIDTGANYDWRGSWEYGTSSTGTASRNFSSATSNIRLGVVGSASSPSGKQARVECIFDNLASGTSARLRFGRTDYDGSAGLTHMEFSGIYNPTTEITAFRIYTASTADGTTASGSMTSGRWVLSGRNRP